MRECKAALKWLPAQRRGWPVSLTLGAPATNLSANDFIALEGTLMRTSIAVFLVALLAAPLQGALVVYSGSDVANSTDPRPNSDAAAASFDAAASGLGPLSLIDFESAPLGLFNNLAVAAGVTMDGLDAFSVDQEIRNTPVGPPDGLWGYNTTVAGSQFVGMTSGYLTFSFSTPVHSFGAYISGLQLDYTTIDFSDGSSQTVPVPNPSSTDGGIAFVGFTDAGLPISAITITTIGDILGVDDVRFGQVPEPSTFVLAFVALVGLLAWRQRKR
jgi:hypothetical protein